MAYELHPGDRVLVLSYLANSFSKIDLNEKLV